MPLMAVFFPDVTFGWAFVACLCVIMAIASYLDLKTARIPKQLSVIGLALGVLFNMTRGALLAQKNETTWYISQPSMLTGAIDGFLFALAGFLFGFVLFLVLWILGVAGGGDVKVFAALGAWLGPRLTLYVLAVTLVIIAILVIAQSMYAVFTGQLKVRKVNPNKPVKRRLITFALPLTIAVGIVLAWKFREELKLAEPTPVATYARGGPNAL